MPGGEVRSIRSVIICSLLASGCTTAARSTVPPGIGRQLVATKTVIHDRPLRLNFLTALHADCSPVGETVVQIIEPPANGKAEIVRTQDYTNYVRGNQRAECNKKKSPGTQITYTSNPGFTGTDRVVLDAIFPNGDALRYRYKLVVR